MVHESGKIIFQWQAQGPRLCKPQFCRRTWDELVNRIIDSYLLWKIFILKFIYLFGKCNIAVFGDINRASIKKDIINDKQNTFKCDK